MSKLKKTFSVSSHTALAGIRVLSVSPVETLNFVFGKLCYLAADSPLTCKPSEESGLRCGKRRVLNLASIQRQTPTDPLLRVHTLRHTPHTHTPVSKWDPLTAGSF